MVKATEIDGRFHCRCCYKMKPVHVKVIHNGKAICQDCMANKKPPSMTRQNVNGPEVYNKKLAEGEWAVKPHLDKWKGRAK